MNDGSIGRWLWVAAGWVMLATALPAYAGIVRIDVDQRSEIAQGAGYGSAGAYERLAGRIRFAVDPGAVVNANVADIAHAPTNADGNVEFAADFFLIKPKDIQRANGTVLFEVANRGRKGMLSMFDHGGGGTSPETAADFGDGFLLREGFTLLWVGWQFDVPEQNGLLRVYAPNAGNDRAPITGPVRSDFVVDRRERYHSLADRGHVAYPVRDPNDPGNTLTVRDSPLGERRTISRERWRFARLDGGRIVPDPTHVYLDGGFDPYRIYEVVYESENPPIAGLGLAAIRDAVSRIEHDGAPALGLPRGSIVRSIGFGLSQSGRLLRTFLYDGFNEDESHRKVFDGLIVHLAGGARGSFNQRFAQPSRASWSYFYPNALFPFSDAAQTDPVTGATDGLLAGVDSAQRPKIFYTNSSNEYWRGSAALTHVSVDGADDLMPPDNVRIYLFAGTQHVPASFPPRRGAGRALPNSNDYRWFLKALLERMNAWITEDAPPPASRYPTLRDGTLVRLSALRFPALPDTPLPDRLRAPRRLDYGPRFRSEHVATQEPPAVGPAFPVLLPQVDVDGNEVAGLRSPEQAVPLATYTGWNLYDRDVGPADRLVELQGSFVPFARTRAERETRTDPRPSIAERYPSRDGYLERVRAHAEALRKAGYLLAEDLPEIVRLAGEHWDAIAR
jgi:hypothetical protein